MPLAASGGDCCAANGKMPCDFGLFDSVVAMTIEKNSSLNSQCANPIFGLP
jgi:hypothetical protein